MEAFDRVSYPASGAARFERASARARVRPIGLALLVGCAAALFSILSVSQHAFYLTPAYLDNGIQVQRHLAVIDGHAGNPWQYRVLAPFLIQPVIDALTQRGVAHPYLISFVSFRLLQDFAVVLVAFLYYRKYGLTMVQALVGMALLGWAMSYAFWDSDLQFSTYFDVLFFLLAGLCALGDAPGWIVPIAALAAFNRETSGFIPFVFAAATFRNDGSAAHGRLAALAGTAFVIYVAVFAWLRWHYGPQDLVLAHGHRAGWDMFRFNVGRFVTWDRVFATFTIVPVVALVGRSQWPPSLTRMFWVLVPAWVLVHAFVGVLAETRLLLVPYALVLVPGALFALRMPDDERSRRAPLVG